MAKPKVIRDGTGDSMSFKVRGNSIRVSNMFDPVETLGYTASRPDQKVCKIMVIWS